MVDRRRILRADRLGLRDREDVKKLLKKHGESADSVQFSGNVTKINRKGKPQERRMLITRKAVYYLSPMGCASKRRIRIKNIAGFTLSAHTDEFLIRVPQEYDVHLHSPLKYLIWRQLRRLYHDMYGAWLGIERVDAASLRGMCVTKHMSREQREAAERRRVELRDPNPVDERHILTMSDDSILNNARTTDVSSLENSLAQIERVLPVAPSARATASASGSQRHSMPDPCRSGDSKLMSSRSAATQASSTLPKHAGARLTRQSRGLSPGPSVAAEAKSRVSLVTLSSALGAPKLNFNRRQKRKKYGTNPPLLDHWNTDVTIRDFEAIRTIGESAYGFTLKVRRRTNGRIRMLKLLKASEVAAHSKLQSIETERKVLLQVLHPFIATLQHSFQSMGYLGLVYSWRGDVDMYFHLQRHQRFEEAVARVQVAELALAIGHLHSKGFAHRDIKPENVYVDAKGHVALTGFGLAKDLGQPVDGRYPSTDTFCGTTEYLAPEMLTDSSCHDCRVDWWMLGILLFELTVGFPPFYSRNIHRLYSRILCSEPQYPERMTTACRHAISGLLKKDPRHRVGSRRGVQQVLSQPFFARIDVKRLLSLGYEPGFPRPAGVGAAARSSATATRARRGVSRGGRDSGVQPRQATTRDTPVARRSTDRPKAEPSTPSPGVVDTRKGAATLPTLEHDDEEDVAEMASPRDGKSQQVVAGNPVPKWHKDGSHSSHYQLSVSKMGPKADPSRSRSLRDAARSRDATPSPARIASTSRISDTNTHTDKRPNTVLNPIVASRYKTSSPTERKGRKSRAAPSRSRAGVSLSPPSRRKAAGTLPSTSGSSAAVGRYGSSGDEDEDSASTHELRANVSEAERIRITIDNLTKRLYLLEAKQSTGAVLARLVSGRAAEVISPLSSSSVPSESAAAGPATELAGQNASSSSAYADAD